jgi:Zn-dependent protease
MELTTIQTIAMWVLPVLFAVTVHEVAHGYVAYLLGDKTARILGRLTLNPVKHIDLFGTIIVPGTLLLLKTGVLFAWAKPVPIDSRNLRHHRRDYALISLAGPMSNFIMAVIWAFISKGGYMLMALNIPGAFAIQMISAAGIMINISLMVFNLLPIPQLDGGHILGCILPRSLAVYYDRLTPYGFFIFLGLLALGILDLIMMPATRFLFNLFSTLFNIPLPG